MGQGEPLWSTHSPFGAGRACVGHIEPIWCRCGDRQSPYEPYRAYMGPAELLWGRCEASRAYMSCIEPIQVRQRHYGADRARVGYIEPLWGRCGARQSLYEPYRVYMGQAEPLWVRQSPCVPHRAPMGQAEGMLSHPLPKLLTHHHAMATGPDLASGPKVWGTPTHPWVLCVPPRVHGDSAGTGSGPAASPASTGTRGFGGCTGSRGSVRGRQGTGCRHHPPGDQE